MVTYPMPDVKDQILAFFRMATDAVLSPISMSMKPATPCALIAEAVLETGFSAPVVVGHCCSVSASEALATLDLVAKAGLNVVSLPMCNLYLQDRAARRTRAGRPRSVAK